VDAVLGWRTVRPLLTLFAALTACASTPAPPTGASGPLEQCRSAVADLRALKVANDIQRRARRGEAAFREGKPQPDTERALAPLVTAELVRKFGKVWNQRLECRTWMCKLTFTAEQPKSHIWENPGELGGRIGAIYDPWRFDIDPATGAKLAVPTMYLALRHPTGEPRTDEQLRAEAARDAPATLDQCQAQQAALRADDEEARADRTEYAAFAREKPSPALTADTARLAIAAFGLPPQPADQVVDCRQSVCKLLIPVTADLIRKLRAFALGFRYDWTVGPGKGPGHEDIYLLWRTQGYGNARQHVREAARAADAARAKCGGLAPGRGGLTVRIDLPASDSDGPPPKATLTAEGTLNGTPMGGCVMRLVEEKLRASPVKGPFSRWSYGYDYLFPTVPRGS
jgi:hypothetical protein